MTYKGYTAVIQYDDRDSILHGRLADTYDNVYFEGMTGEELERRFHEAVDDYLAHCAENGREPSKPIAGDDSIRISSELHEQVRIAAEQAGKSFDTFVTEALAKASQLPSAPREPKPPHPLEAQRKGDEQTILNWVDMAHQHRQVALMIMDSFSKLVPPTDKTGHHPLNRRKPDNIVRLLADC